MIIDKTKIKKILLIKLKGIGDVVLSTVVLENLKNEFPAASIDFLTERPSLPLLEGLQHLQKVYTLPKDFAGRFKIAREIRKCQYDLIFDFYSNPTTAQITFFSGAKYRAGFPYRGRRYAYNLFGPERRDLFHAAQLHLEMLRNLNLTTASRQLFVNITPEDELFVENWLHSNAGGIKSMFGVSPTGGWPSKKCPPNKMADFALAVTQKYNLPAIIIWGPGDENEAHEIKRLLGEKGLLAPATTLREMAALFKRCKFLIANDSGPMHIAAAVSTPVLSIHGPTNPLHQGPWGDKNETVLKEDLDCILCNLLTCPRKQECFNNLLAEEVLQKVELLIHKNRIEF